jgi:hypothetical protein
MGNGAEAADDEAVVLERKEVADVPHPPER